MKIHLATLSLFVAVLFSSFLSTQARAQWKGCEVSWYTTDTMCTVYFYGINTGGAPMGSYSYSWNFGDGQTFNGFDPVQHTYSASGTYSVCFTYGITAPGGTCTITECKPETVQCIPMGIADLGDKQSILIYPNPSSGVVNLEIPKNLEAQSIEIYNVMGEKVYKDDYFKIDRFSNSQIDLSSQPGGTYFLQVIPITIGSENEMAVQKIILYK